MSEHAKARFEETPAGLVVRLPSPRRRLVGAMIGVWLAGWAFGLAFMIGQFFTGGPFGSARVFLLLWCVVWLAAGAGAAGYMAWLLAGHERIEIAPPWLVIRRGALGVGFTRRYPLERITRMHPFGRGLTPVLAVGLDVSGQGATGAQFNVGERVVRFGRALDEDEARAVIDAIKRHHPLAGATPAPASAPATPGPPAAGA